MGNFNLTLRNVARRDDGSWSAARIVDDRGRQFQWYDRGVVDQWVNWRSGGGGYWRRCPAKTQDYVAAFVVAARAAEARK